MEPAPPDEDDVIYVAALRRNFGEDIDLLGRLLAKFRARYPGQVDAIRQALARGDGNAAAEAAHRLAGETSVFYARAARQTAIEIEDLARAGDVASATVACHALDVEVERLSELVRRLSP